MRGPCGPRWPNSIERSSADRSSRQKTAARARAERLREKKHLHKWGEVGGAHTGGLLYAGAKGEGWGRGGDARERSGRKKGAAVLSRGAAPPAPRRPKRTERGRGRGRARGACSGTRCTWGVGGMIGPWGVFCGLRVGANGRCRRAKEDGEEGAGRGGAGERAKRGASFGACRPRRHHQKPNWSGKAGLGHKWRRRHRRGWGKARGRSRAGAG